LSTKKDLKNIMKPYRLKKHLSLFDALNIMLRAGVSILPVIDKDNKVVGMIDFSSIFNNINSGGE
jgi:osmoprotectant transport system ATP-binding protein